MTPVVGLGLRAGRLLGIAAQACQVWRAPRPLHQPLVSPIYNLSYSMQVVHLSKELL